MKRSAMLLQKLCLNTTFEDNSSLLTTPADISSTRDPGLEDRDRHAILYIVVVLLFYSIGIIIGIITYLKREKEEIEEDKTYEDYMNFRSDPDKWARYFRVQRMVSHLNWVEQQQDKRKMRENILQMSAEEGKSAEHTGEDVGSPPGGDDTGTGVQGGKKLKRSGLRLSLSPRNPRPEGDLQQVHVVIEHCGEKSWQPQGPSGQGKGKEGEGENGENDMLCNPSSQTVACKDDMDVSNPNLGPKRNVMRMTSL